MSERKVFCAKLKQELPGLPEPPFDSDLGKKIYDQISQQAWGQWMEHCKMLLNEYRLNPARKQDQEVIVKQMEQFFFGEGSARPAAYVPPTNGARWARNGARQAIRGRQPILWRVTDRLPLSLNTFPIHRLVTLVGDN